MKRTVLVTSRENLCEPGRNIKITVEYDGTDYAGWQRQIDRSLKTPGLHKARTVQGTIEKTLKGILHEDIRIIGSGRTDAGVHAKAQTANFKTCSKIPVKNLQKALNSLLPHDISIASVAVATPLFHSRFHAKRKSYRYTCLLYTSPSPRD